jgi:hypothetical protein
MRRSENILRFVVARDNYDGFQHPQFPYFHENFISLFFFTDFLIMAKPQSGLFHTVFKKKKNQFCDIKNWGKNSKKIK